MAQLARNLEERIRVGEEEDVRATFRCRVSRRLRSDQQRVMAFAENTVWWSWYGPRGAERQGLWAIGECSAERDGRHVRFRTPVSDEELLFDPEEDGDRFVRMLRDGPVGPGHH